MGFQCACLTGLTTRSRAPLKRYNNLTADIYPNKKKLLEEVTIAPDREINVEKNTKKKIDNLIEYAQKNPNRIPKIARRLERRILSAVARGEMRGPNMDAGSKYYAYVHIATEGFIALLQECTANLSLFAKHALRIADMLLAKQSRDLQMLAVKLLRNFWEYEPDATYRQQLEGFVEPLYKLSMMQQSQSQSQSQASPHISNSTSSSASTAHDLRWRRKVLEALKECVRWMARTASLSKQLDTVIAAALHSLAATKHAALEVHSMPIHSVTSPTPPMLGHAASSPEPKGRSSEVQDLEEINLREDSRDGASGRVQQGGDSRSLVLELHTQALDVLSQVSSLARDAQSARRVLDPLLNFFDTHKWWTCENRLVGTCVRAVMAKMSSSDSGTGGHEHVLVSSLIKRISQTTHHQDGSQGNDDVALAILRLLTDSINHMMPDPLLHGPVVPAHRMAGSVVLAISTFARRWPVVPAEDAPEQEEDQKRSADGVISPVVTSCIAALANSVGEVASLVEVIAAVMEKLPSLKEEQEQLASLHLLGTVTNVAAEMREYDACFLGDSFPQGLLLAMFPVLSCAQERVCLAAHRLLHAMFQTKALPMLSRSTTLNQPAAVQEFVFSDTQAAMVLGSVWERCCVTHTTPPPATVTNVNSSSTPLGAGASSGGSASATTSAAAAAGSAVTVPNQSSTSNTSTGGRCGSGGGGGGLSGGGGVLSLDLGQQLCATFLLALTHSDPAGATILQAAPLAFKVHKLASAAINPAAHASTTAVAAAAMGVIVPPPQPPDEREEEMDDEDSQHLSVKPESSGHGQRKLEELQTSGLSGSRTSVLDEKATPEDMTSEDRSLLELVSLVMVACLGRVYGCEEALRLVVEQAHDWGLDASTWVEAMGSPLSAFAYRYLLQPAFLNFKLTAFTPKDIIVSLSRVPTLSTNHGGAKQLRADLQREYTFTPPVGMHGGLAYLGNAEVLTSPFKKRENEEPTPTLPPKPKVTPVKDIDLKKRTIDFVPKGQLASEAPSFDRMTKYCKDSEKNSLGEVMKVVSLSENHPRSRDSTTSVTFQDSVFAPGIAAPGFPCGPPLLPPVGRVDAFLNSIRCS